MSYYTNKKILIIGGTGTIGEHLLATLLKENPTVIRILSRDEYKQFKMRERYPQKSIRFLIGDVRDYERIERASNDIDIIFHLAAMKHVPSCEYDPFEAVKTNVYGTQNVITAALNNNVSKVIFTSSDKAVSPTNALGATKLLAEKLITTSHNFRGAQDIAFASVRFGNVMGTRGSVIPLFKKQIEDGRYVTVTNPNMSRFMMSIDEAVRLVLKAGEIAVGGETFVLKMPILRLGDFADVFVSEYCREKGIDASTIERREIGLRLGEKMYEELMTYEESENAYDLTNMYMLTDRNLTNVYKKAETKSYTSHDTPPISQDEVRELMLKENLI